MPCIIKRLPHRNAVLLYIQSVIKEFLLMDIKGVNIKALQYINELLTEQMNHWLMFPFVLFLSVYSRRTGDFSGILIVVMWTICSLLPLAFFILRLKVKSVTRFFILQPVAALPLLAAATTILLSNGYLYHTGRLICIVCAVCYMLYSTLLYLKKKEPFTGPMQLSLGVAISAGCMFFEAITSGADPAVVMGYRIFPLIISVGLYFIIIYIQRYIDFLNVNKSSAGYLPATEMFHSGFGLAIGYTILGVVLIAVLACGPWIGRLGTYLMDLFDKFFKWLIAKFKGSSAEDEIPIVEDFGTTPGQLPGFKINDTFWLWTLLEYALVFAVLVALFIIFVRLLIKLIQYLQGLALSRVSISDTGEVDAFDIHEKCDIEDKSGKRRQRHFGPLSYSDRIRRLYKKKLLSSTGQMTFRESKMLGVYTAREWERKLATQGMASVYEQARYSGQEMTAEDVKRMKDACR